MYYYFCEVLIFALHDILLQVQYLYNNNEVSDLRVYHVIAISFTAYIENVVHDCNVSNDRPKKKYGPYVAMSVQGPFKVFFF